MKTIHLQDFLDMIGADLNVKRYNNQNERWMAQIEGCEVKEGVILAGYYGTGTDPDDAILDYLDKIRGQKIVLRAYSKDRAEYNVPESITYKTKSL